MSQEEFFYKGSGVTKVSDWYIRMWRRKEFCHYIIKYPENDYYVYFINPELIHDHEKFRPDNFKKLVKFSDCGKNIMLQSKFSSVEKDEREKFNLIF